MENNSFIENTSRIYDRVFIYKLFNNPMMLENLKRIESYEVFTSLKEFCTEELNVCFYYYYPYTTTKHLYNLKTV